MIAETPLGREIGERVSVVVLAGVAGSGKSTVGNALSAALGWPYGEADAFHPQSNIDKMTRGEPLTDADRAPWLETIAAFIDGVCARGDHAIVSCSALKRAYRATLVGQHADRVRIVLLEGGHGLIAARLSGREGHFMPPSLLQSQFAALEDPAPDEHAIVVPVGGSKDEVVANVLAALRA